MHKYYAVKFVTAHGSNQGDPQKREFTQLLDRETFSVALQTMVHIVLFLKLSPLYQTLLGNSATHTFPSVLPEEKVMPQKEEKRRACELKLDRSEDLF